MRVATGRVTAGKIIVEGEPFEEGSLVTVLALDDDEEAVQLSPEEAAELRAALAEADAGDFVNAEQVLQELLDQH